MTIAYTALAWHCTVKTSRVRVADEEEDETTPSVVTSKHVSLQLVVPGHAVGAVIGQQGSQIKQVSSRRELSDQRVAVLLQDECQR